MGGETFIMKSQLLIQETESLSYVRKLTRNARALEIDQIMSNPSISNARKEQKRNNMRRAEAQYLRFLRTKETPENYKTLKIIGKGAFGEVKLVQRKNDEKIYALKSLVKQEMVSSKNSSFDLTLLI